MNGMRLFFCLSLSVVSLAQGAFAWSPPGHEQIADIAWTRLNERAKREVAAILAAGDPKFRPNRAGETGLRRAFRRAATFPDVIKGDTSTQYEATIVTLNDLWSPRTDPLVGEREKLRCKTWHYYDTPIRFSGTEPRVARSNALAALTHARGELTRHQQSRSPNRRLQCWWLYWITHVVGDLHQPLHCAEDFKFHSDGDEGGNLFLLKRSASGGQKPRLHGYWDGGIDRAKQMGREVGLSAGVEEVTRRWTEDRGLAPGTSAVENLDVASWIRNGAVLAEARVYMNIEPDTAPSSEYVNGHVDLCKRQAVLAGFRLAQLLNESLGE